MFDRLEDGGSDRHIATNGVTLSSTDDSRLRADGEFSDAVATGDMEHVDRKDDTMPTWAAGGAKSFQVPALKNLTSIAEQTNFLLLAWALLLSRGSIVLGNGNNPLYCCWGIYESGPGLQSSLPRALSMEKVEDMIPSDTEGISELLQKTKIFTQSRDSDSGVEIEEPTPSQQRQSALDWGNRVMVLFAKDDVSSLQLLDGSPSFGVDVHINKGRLYIRRSRLAASTLSSEMAEFQVCGLIDILESILRSGQDKVMMNTGTLGDHELARLWEWNKAVPQAIKRCMHDIVAERVAEHPEKLAVESWDGELTYGQLDRLSGHLAVQLSNVGVRLGTSVPLCFEKSMWAVVALLAVMRVGATFVLTDPQQPEGRLSTIAAEVKAHVVITSVKQAILGARIAPRATIVTVGPELLPLSGQPVAIQLAPVPSWAVLYIIFTSGSTGKPKGVMISHENFTTGAIPRADAVGYRPHSRVLDFPSYAFDVSIDCMLCTLANGGCICIPSDDQRVNDLSGAITSLKANMAHMTPSVARLLSVEALASLEVLGLGGESLSAGEAALWGKTTKVIIAYGPSECTVGCTINNEIDTTLPYTSIGKGVGGVTWIVDPDNHDALTPVGAVGELLVEGPIVGVGYLNEPDKTSQVFIDDPAWLVAGAGTTPGRHGRLYKTGDLVKYDPCGSGNLVFAGRKDRQVKLRGQRVELAEIEHHLLQKLPAAVSVAVEVITPGGKDREPSLVAFIAERKDKNEATNVQELRSLSSELRQLLPHIEKYLSAQLPRYMVPTAYIPLASLPLLVSCKVDRKRLQEIGLSMTPRQLAKLRTGVVEDPEPKTDEQQTLQRVWKTVLGSELDIGVNDNFFAMGGDSLKAMKLVAVARAEGLSLTVAQIFANPTLARMSATAGHVGSESEADIPPYSLLAQDWKAADARNQVADLCKLAESDIEDVYPCTPLQEGLMALSAKYSDAYVAQRVVDLPNTQTANLLRSAFEAVSSSCPILRTRIVQVPGRGLMQVVIKGELPWKLSDNLEQYLQHDNSDGMGLGDALARFGLVTNAKGKDGKTHVVFSIHHALYDGWSMPLVIERVNKAYQGLEIKQPTPFKSFIRYLLDRDRPSSEAFWTEQLRGATGLQFPVVPVASYQPRANALLEHYVTFPRSMSSNTTIATAIRAAWALVAGRFTAAQDVVFGETLTGRNAPVAGIGEIEGPLITTVPMRVRVDVDLSISEYLQSVHDQTVLRIPHEHMGLQHIRRLSADAREACELRTGIVLHPSGENESREADVDIFCPANGFMPVNDVEAAQEALRFNSYALMLVCSLDSRGFLTMASFDTTTVDQPQMQNVLQLFGQTVQELCEESNTRIGDLDIMRDPSPADLLPLSNLGVHSLPRAGQSEINAIQKSVKRTWIVDPARPERLLPAGAVGELLLEATEAAPLAQIDKSDWILNDGSKEHTYLYQTGHLVKQNTDGSIVFLRLKGERPQISARASSKSNGPGVTQNRLLPKRQAQLRQLWSRILGIADDEIDSESSFFALGGDSIGVMKLVSEARLHGLELSVAQVFRHRRLFEMADTAKETHHEPTAVESITPFSALGVGDVDDFVSKAIKPALTEGKWKIKDVLPTRPLQEIAVNGTIHLPRYSARYEIFYLDGPIDRQRLAKSCQELISRNEILRTVFVAHQKRWYGVVLEDLEVPIVYFAIEGDLESFAKKLCDLDIQTQMPPGTAFVKFFFVQGGNGQSCLILRISHAQYDEMCLPRLLHQLAALYEEKTIPESLPFSTFVHHSLRKNIPESIQYWRDLLQGSHMTTLRPMTSLASSQHVSFTRTFDLSARSTDTTIATLPTAAWALCLARHLSLRDVTFGEVVSGRNIDLPNCDMIMGPTWQYIPVRVKFDSDWSAADLLNFVQQQHIESSRFEGIGLSEIIRDCTDWPKTVDWFDSVVHQDVEHVETLSFLTANSRMETVYPHLEPLREWKIQAFLKDESLTIEVVTFKEWSDLGTSLLDCLGSCLRQLVNEPQSALFKPAENGWNAVPLKVAESKDAFVSHTNGVVKGKTVLVHDTVFEDSSRPARLPSKSASVVALGRSGKKTKFHKRIQTWFPRLQQRATL